MAKGCLLGCTCVIGFSVKKKKKTEVDEGFARPADFLTPYLPSNKVNSELDVCSVGTSPEGSQTGCFILFFLFSPLFFFQISESPEYAYWRYCGGPGVHGVCVGVTQQGHTPQDEEAVPNHVCNSHYAVELLLDLLSGRRHGVHVRDHSSSPLDVCPCFAEAPEHKEQAGEQNGRNRFEEDPDGHHTGCPRTAGG